MLVASAAQRALKAPNSRWVRRIAEGVLMGKPKTPTLAVIRDVREVSVGNMKAPTLDVLPGVHANGTRSAAFAVMRAVRGAPTDGSIPRKSTAPSTDASDGTAHRVSGRFVQVSEISTEGLAAA